MRKAQYMPNFKDYDFRINNEFNSNLIQQSKKLRKKTKVWELYYLYDKAPIYTSVVSTSVIRCSDITVLPHSSFTLIFAKSNFYIFIFLYI